MPWKRERDGWTFRAGFHESQPFVVFVAHYTEADYKPKKGFQAQFGEFAGTTKNIAPVRKSRSMALSDARKFMRKYNTHNKIKRRLYQDIRSSGSLSR